MDFSTENDTLSRISKALYGDALTLAVMDPKDSRRSYAVDGSQP